MPSDPINIEVTADVAADPETVFDLLADLHGADAWLPSGLIYRGTEDISDDPVVVGTTYYETGLIGHRNGTVVALDRPRLLEFDQPFTARLRLGRVQVKVRVEISPTESGSHVARKVEIHLPGHVRPFSRMIIARFIHEGERVMEALERYFTQEALASRIAPARESE